MSKLGTITRRSFLVASAAITGGFVLGYWAYKKDPDNPLLDNLQPGEASLNPYIRIDQSGITIIAPRADLGQGVHSALAALVAEELEVSIDSIKVEHGPVSAAYWNGLGMSEAFPIRSTDTGWLHEIATTTSDVLGKLMGMQVTGGSSSVADGYTKMRKAGAAGREMILMAAANLWSVPRETLNVENGVVTNQKGQQATYQELAAKAAKFTPPENPPMKSSQQWKQLGHKMKRVDMVAKCTGKQRFGIDQHFPKMVYASARTNPNLGKHFKSFDAAKAHEMPGVLKVVPVSQGIAVIADNTWRAFKAVNSIAFDWEPATYPQNTKDMFESVQRSLLNDDHKDSQFQDTGDVEKNLEGNPEEVWSKYKVPFLAHAPLEPMNAVALFSENKLQLWTSNQLPSMLRDQLVKLTKLDPEQIEIEILMAGGSFGRRLEVDYALQATEIAMQYPDVPVKLTWTREEDMTHDPCRPLAVAEGRGAVKDGKIDTFDLHVASPSVVASQFGRIDFPVPGPDLTIVAGSWDQPFKIPNFRVTGYRTPEMTPISSWRSVGASINGFFFNSFFDELAEKAGADPLQERIRLCSHRESKLALEAVAEMSDWKNVKMQTGQGRGVAFTVSFGVPTAQVVYVSQTPDGIKVDKVFVAMEVGKVIDPVNFENQIQGAVVWGLGHAMFAEITFADGKVQQNNFHLFNGLKLNQTPDIIVQGLENGDRVLGAGEPAVPPVAGALANAIKDATGKRIRELPFKKSISFV